MSVTKPRRRLVYFRLSEDEFQRVSSLCEEAGARSISDLARTAIQEFVANGQGNGSDLLHSKLSDLDRALSELNNHLRELTHALKTRLVEGSHE